jgi:hypothetical protein
VHQSNKSRKCLFFKGELEFLSIILSFDKSLFIRRYVGDVDSSSDFLMILRDNKIIIKKLIKVAILCRFEYEKKLLINYLKK